MAINQMKSETLEEARERLREQSALEREGFEAASEGQLVTDRADPRVADDDDDDGFRAAMHERVEADRVAPSAQDRADAASVEAQRRAMSNPRDAQIYGEPKRARKASQSAKKSDGE